MRRRPSSQNNGSYQNKRPRYQHGHSGSGGGMSSQNRPRKNYSAMREKYMNQARDALSGGDRVMAEYFYQHADHCYRMMVEEGSYQQRPQYSQGQAADGSPRPESAEPADTASAEDIVPASGNALPAFLYAQAAQPATEPVVVQNWEERDA